ncbi:hypothetical protein Tco_0477562 [Tanacetum coccineum]
MYNDVNINLEGRDTEMTDALLVNVQTTQVIEDTHVIITVVTPEVQQHSSSVSSGFISNMLNPNLDTSIDSILNLNTESTSLVDIPVTTNVEMPPSSVTTPPPLPIPLIYPLQQTPVPIPTIVLISSIPSIVDKYLANQMNEAVKAAIQLQSKRLRSESQADNEDFINKIDENIKKIIKEQAKNKTLPTIHGPIQPWISTLARNEDPLESFDELVDTPLDLSAFVLNWLKVDALTSELLADPTFELMKGSCKSLVELEYFLEEVCKATTDQLDWNNPEG